MRIQVEQNKFNKYISIVQKGIPSKSTLPILDGILLETIDGKLKLTGTDLDMGIESYVDCNILEEGSIVINSKLFGDIIRKLPDSTIDLSVVDNKIINIECENSKFNLIGNSAIEYPELPTLIDRLCFMLPSDLLKNIIRQTTFATIVDETRPILTGVLLEIIDKKASFVALDGYRLSLRSIPIDCPEDIKIIIPSRTLNELYKILPDDDSNVEIALTSTHVLFNLGDTVVSSRLLEGQFLNYRDIIREEHNTRVIADRAQLNASLERASLLAREEKANLIKLNILDGKMIIKSNSEIGNVYEEIPVDIEGDEINIAFNSKYILDGIKSIESEKIELYFLNSLNPCIMKPYDDESYTYLVLPVRLASDDY